MPQQTIFQNIDEMPVSIDTTGESIKKIPKFLVAEDSYEPSAITKIDTALMPVWGKPDAPREPKLVFSVQLSDAHKTVLPMFVAPSVLKGSGKYSDSTLFKILDKAGLIVEIESEKLATKNIGALRLFLTSRLVNRKCKVLVNTVNKGKPEAYSRVADIIKFL